MDAYYYGIFRKHLLLAAFFLSLAIKGNCSLCSLFWTKGRRKWVSLGIQVTTSGLSQKYWLSLQWVWSFLGLGWSHWVLPENSARFTHEKALWSLASFVVMHQLSQEAAGSRQGESNRASWSFRERAFSLKKALFRIWSAAVPTLILKL